MFKNIYNMKTQVFVIINLIGISYRLQKCAHSVKKNQLLQLFCSHSKFKIQMTVKAGHTVR